MDNGVHKKVDQFFKNYPRVNYPKDQILIFPGEDVKKVYYIVTGRVSQYDISYRGEEVVVNTFKPPAFFSMAMAINQMASAFFYKAETKTTVHVAPSSEVLTFVQSNPDVTYDLLARVYRGIDSVLDRTVHLMSGTARSRLLFDLIVEFRRFGKTEGAEKYIESSETSIASRSGLSRETVSREMKHLKDKGLVEIKSHRIYLRDIAELENLLRHHL